MSGHTWSREESQMVFSLENRYVRSYAGERRAMRMRLKSNFSTLADLSDVFLGSLSDTQFLKSANA